MMTGVSSVKIKPDKKRVKKFRVHCYAFHCLKYDKNEKVQTIYRDVSSTGI